MQIDFDLEQAPLQSMHLSAWGKEPPLTTKIPGFAGCLDYIWLSHGKFAVTHTLQMPYVISSDPDCAYDHFPVLPNGAFSSDHLAMGCKIVWT